MVGRRVRTPTLVNMFSVMLFGVSLPIDYILFSADKNSKHSQFYYSDRQKWCQYLNSFIYLAKILKLVYYFSIFLYKTVDKYLTCVFSYIFAISFDFITTFVKLSMNTQNVLLYERSFVLFSKTITFDRNTNILLFFIGCQ